MFEYEIQRCTRRCAKTGKELQPGEEFFSALVSEGNEIARVDFSHEGWDGPPEDSLGWWKSHMPSASANKMHWAPNDVMLHFFQELENQEDKEDIRYVLALLMIRRRVVRLEDTETDEQCRELLVIYCSRNETEYKVPVVDPTEERIGQIQDELAKLLFAEAT